MFDYRYDLPTYVDGTDLVNVVVEIPKGSNIKYELDPTTGHYLTAVRTLSKKGMKKYIYPFNYGFIANTIAEDHDQLDAVILSEESYAPLTVLQCKVIGVIRTIDNGEQDDKILVVPAYSEIKEIDLDKILKFLREYKYPDQEGTIIGETLPSEAAHDFIKECRFYLNKKR